MANIAIITTGLTGILNASLELANRLEQEGNTITYVCPRDVRLLVEIQGFVFQKIPMVNFDFDKTLLDDNERAKSATWSYEEGKQILRLDSYKNVLAELKPDMVLVDVELHELILTSLSLSIPTHLLTQWYPNRFHPNVPHLMSALVPKEKSMVSSIKILMGWGKRWIRMKTRIQLNRIRGMGGRRDTLRRYAAEIGLPKGSLRDSNFPPVFIYNNLPVYSLTLEDSDFPDNSHANFYYLGPMVAEERDIDFARHRDYPIIKNLFKIRDQHNLKLIYCSVSSFKKGDPQFLQKVVEAVADKQDWMLIISLGGNLEVEELGILPKNVHPFKWVPQLEVLQRADCSINHGGIHSINECIHFSTPMLVYSGKRFDQNGCASRMAYHGIGLVGDKDKDNSEHIKQKLEAVLSPDSIVQQKMQRMNQAYQNKRKGELSTFFKN